LSSKDLKLDPVRAQALPARGDVFEACRGRAVLADGMGLGKTIQALATAELLGQSRGIERVL
jgi:SNF2 family DNA or RNA helicase